MVMYLDFFFNKAPSNKVHILNFDGFTSWLLKAQIEYRAETKQ